MIEIGINQIYKNYGYKPVLTGASFEVMTGERVGLVGRNGSGKSTILKIITGEESVEKGTVSIRKGATVGYLEQIPVLSENSATTGEVLSQVFSQVHDTEQELRSLEISMGIEKNPDKLNELMARYEDTQNKFIAMDGYSVGERFDRIVTGFNLMELLDRPFNILSGGQKTIVKLACTVLQEPDILLLDEPTNHLDIKTLEWFESYLSKYRGTVLIISHDRYFLDRTTTKTIVLESGECTMFHGNYSFSMKEQERLLLLEFENYKNQQKKISAMRAAIARFRQWGAQADNPKFFRKAKELEKKLEKIELIDRPQLEKTKIPLTFSGNRSGRDVLTVKNFNISFDGIHLLRDVNFAVFEKEKACLVGNNGTGKTTLVKSIIGALDCYSGEIKINPSARIGYIPQEIRFDNDKISVLDVFRSEHPCPEDQARRLLAKYFFYGESVFKRASSLSGGEKVLLKLAILIQNDINFLILDEPTNHIDIETREMLEESLLDFPFTILCISHDRYFIKKIANKILTINDMQVSEGYK